MSHLYLFLFSLLPIASSAQGKMEYSQDIQSSNGLIHVNMPYNNGIHHADILRSIKYYHSGKIMMRFRIGSFSLSSVNNDWWFFQLNGVK